MRQRIFIIWTMMFLSVPTFASGIKLHMLMADMAVNLIPYEDLKSLLKEQRDFYLNGSIFPDSGYLTHAEYSTFAHETGFMNLSISYISEQCPGNSFLNPQQTKCRQLLAYFLGSVAHVVGDHNFDGNFLTKAAELEFHNDLDKAHEFTDHMLDFIAIVDLDEAKYIPSKVYPLDALTNIYEKASSLQIIPYQVPAILLSKSINFQYWLNVKALQKFAHIVAPRVKTMHPWVLRNYVDAKGGIKDSGDKIAAFWERIWNILVLQGKLPVFSESGNWPHVKLWVL